MIGRTFELVAWPLRAVRRAAFWWSVGLAGLVVATVAFWPAFKGSTGISDALDQLPSGLVQAFGLENFGTPAGYLRGNLYELFVPLLFAAVAIVFVNGQTAGEESAGRLELILAQPVGRRAVFLGRALAALIALALVVAVTTVAQLLMDAALDLEIDTSYLLATIVLCGLLGALHGGLALAIAGFRARPSLVVGLTVAVALAGYLVAALFPLSDLLAPWRHLSPWDWALGGDPLEKATDLWRYAALAVPAIVLALLGAVAVARRDVASA